MSEETREALQAQMDQRQEVLRAYEEQVTILSGEASARQQERLGLVKRLAGGDGSVKKALDRLDNAERESDARLSGFGALIEDEQSVVDELRRRIIEFTQNERTAERQKALELAIINEQGARTNVVAYEMELADCLARWHDTIGALAGFDARLASERWEAMSLRSPLRQRLEDAGWHEKRCAQGILVTEVGPMARPSVDEMARAVLSSDVKPLFEDGEVPAPGL